MPIPPKPPPKGTRYGGRTKGTPNKKSTDLRAYLDELGCKPEERLAMIVMAKLPCGTCFGKGKTKYRTETGKIASRTCLSCYGVLLEPVNASQVESAASTLMKYLRPQLKAIEVSGNDDKPPVRVRVEFVE